MTSFFAFLLGILQGLTEFLPVSSTGHLWAFRHLTGQTISEPQLAFDIALHVATLAVIIIYFRRELLGLVRGCAGRSAPGETGPEEQRYLAFLITLTLIPTGLVFLLFGDFLEGAGSRKETLGSAFLMSAGFLFATRFSVRRGARITRWREMPVAYALWIGLAQGVALTPGISRAGATVAAALLLGLDRDLAVRFSFLMAIPAIVGASLLPAVRGFAGMSPLVLLSGMVAAFVVGLGTIHLLRWVVVSRRFHWFAAYLGLIGVVVLIWGHG